MAVEKLVSPKAKCKWVNVKRPHPEYDVFQINLLLPAKSKEAKSWMSTIDDWIAEEVKSSGAKPSEYVPYKEDGDDILFKFKQKASILTVSLSISQLAKLNHFRFVRICVATQILLKRF